MSRFEHIVREYGPLLMRDFAFTAVDAAAVFGNIGHECNGVENLQELKPLKPGSRGGYGWCQWTGPRRRAYEAYCKRNKLNPADDQANYAFLFVELKGPEAKAVDAVKRASGLVAKVKAFELAFLRAGIKHYDSRNIWAAQAYRILAAANAPHTDQSTKTDLQPSRPVPSAPPVPPPVPLGLIAVLLFGVALVIGVALLFQLLSK